MISDDMISEPLLLSPDVMLTETRAYPEALRKRMGAQSGDRVLSLARSRYTSQRIDFETAQFLRRFETPTGIVEAVIAHAAETDEDPSSLLEAVFPLVCRLKSQRILISPLDVNRPPEVPLFTPGQTILSYSVLSCIETETETEIYLAEGPTGRVVLKHVPPTAPGFVTRALKVESAVLRRLERAGMQGIPRVLSSDSISTGRLLVLSWQDGDVLEGFSARRQLPVDQRLELCLGLAEQYSRLHANGFLHGDVHGRNVIVDNDLRVSLIDFGAASRTSAKSKRPRMALLPDLEPEAAREVHASRNLPPSSPAGEQYCLAALIFAVLTDEPPVQLSLETAVAMRQIAETPPATLNDKGLRLDAVDRVLSKALSKDPIDRFDSLVSFAEAFSQVASRKSTIHRAARLQRESSGSIAALYGLDGRIIRSEIPHGARAGIYYGAAGVAYALLRYAILRQDADSLAAAEIWVERALADKSSAAYEWPEVGVSKQTIGVRSPFNGYTGVRLTEAMIRILTGDDEAALEACLEVAAAAAHSASSGEFNYQLDLLHGDSGRLLGLALVMPGLSTIGRHQVAEAAKSLRGGVELALSESLRAPGCAKPYLGMAHGLAGAVYSLLNFCEAAAEFPSDAAIQGLDRLAHLGTSTSAGIAWPVRLSDPEGLWTGWCHGLAGHLLLWCAAARILNDSTHLNRALAIGETLSRARTEAAATLCCGEPGEALALFTLGQSTSEGRWFDLGRSRLTDQRGGDPQIPAPHSLFRGSLGMNLARLEAIEPERSAWPFCTVPL